MKIKNWWLFYLKSKLNLVVSSGFLTIAVVSALLLEQEYKIIIPAAALILFLITTSLLMFSKKGAETINKIAEKARLKKIYKKIHNYEQIREKLTHLRISDEQVRKALEYFLLVSGDYLSKCNELKSYSPEANQQIQEALTICQIYLEELDESSTEKRYNIIDPQDFTNFKKKTCQSLTEAGQLIKEKMSHDLVGVTRKDTLEIIEEMRK